jgi:hypothetical protein
MDMDWTRDPPSKAAGIFLIHHVQTRCGANKDSYPIITYGFVSEVNTVED